jgi:hypothetical protein
MHRLAFALALVPALFAGGARAQTVSEDMVKTLWCGEAFTALFAMEKSQIDPGAQPTYDAFVAAAAKLVETGTQGYLDAGYTEEQVSKIKADLVTEVTPIVTSQGQAGKYSPDVCNPVLHKVLVLPTPASSPAGDASSAPSAPAADASSSAQ